MISLVVLAAHMLGDFVLQTDWMAENKLRSAIARTAHVSVYTTCFIPVAWYAALPLQRAAIFLAVVFITHWITDSRRWVSGDKWPPKPILIDQALHIIQLAVTCVAFSIR